MPSALTTPLGAKVTVADLPESLDVGKLAGGCMLMLDMVDPADPRHAEVALSLENMADLRRALEVL